MAHATTSLSTILVQNITPPPPCWLLSRWRRRCSWGKNQSLLQPSGPSRVALHSSVIKTWLLHVLLGPHVLAVLPTGFGKSLIFQLYAIAKSKLKILDGGVQSSVIMVCPLESIMKDQIAEAQSIGITTCSLSDARLTDVTPNPPQLLFASAESVKDQVFRVALERHQFSTAQVCVSDSCRRIPYCWDVDS